MSHTQMRWVVGCLGISFMVGPISMVLAEPCNHKIVPAMSGCCDPSFCSGLGPQDCQLGAPANPYSCQSAFRVPTRAAWLCKDNPNPDAISLCTETGDIRPCFRYLVCSYTDVSAVCREGVSECGAPTEFKSTAIDGGLCDQE